MSFPCCPRCRIALSRFSTSLGIGLLNGAEARSAARASARAKSKSNHLRDFNGVPAAESYDTALDGYLPHESGILDSDLDAEGFQRDSQGI